MPGAGTGSTEAVPRAVTAFGRTLASRVSVAAARTDMQTASRVYQACLSQGQRIAVHRVSRPARTGITASASRWRLGQPNLELRRIAAEDQAVVTEMAAAAQRKEIGPGVVPVCAVNLSPFQGLTAGAVFRAACAGIVFSLAAPDVYPAVTGMLLSS